MEKESNKDIIEIIHPLLIDISQVLRKHFNNLVNLSDNDKTIALDTVDEILKIIFNAYKSDIFNDMEDNFEYDAVEELIKAYLRIAYISSSKKKEINP